MTHLILSIVSLLCALVLGEILLWRLFRRRIDPVIFPSDSDASQLRFFHLGRVRFIALCHTIVLGAWLFLSVAWLW